MMPVISVSQSVLTNNIGRYSEVYMATYIDKNRSVYEV